MLKKLNHQVFFKKIKYKVLFKKIDFLTIFIMKNLNDDF